MKYSIIAIAVLTCALSNFGQLVISGNENKIDLVSGAAAVVANAEPDSITLIDFSISPPRVEHLRGIPNSVIGPPSNIAITPNARLALIANSLKIDPKDSTQWIPDSYVHVLDLKAEPPKVISRVDTGLQPSGISITPNGRLALVANRADGTVSVLSITGKEVKRIRDIRVCDPDLSVSDVAINPAGNLALASIQKGGYLAVLKIDGDQVTVTSRNLSVYGQPYRCVITPDGELGLTAGQGFGSGLDIDALSVIDLKADPIRTIDHISIGSGPESIEISPDGKLVAVVLMNQSNLAPDDPNLTMQGELVILSRRGRTFEKVQELPVGRIPEGVAFTGDGRFLIVQCHPSRQLWVFSVEGEKVHDTGMRITVPGMPSALRAAR